MRSGSVYSGTGWRTASRLSPAKDGDKLPDDMSESADVPADLPPEVEAKIQRIMDETGRSRDEVIQGQFKAFFHAVDHPTGHDAAFVQVVRRRIKEAGAGG